MHFILIKSSRSSVEVYFKQVCENVQNMGSMGRMNILAKLR